MKLRNRLGNAWWNEVIFHVCDFLLRQNVSAFYLFMFLLTRDQRCRLDTNNGWVLEPEPDVVLKAPNWNAPNQERKQ